MERRASIDLLRIMSAIAVITIHVISAPVTSSTAVIAESLLHNLNLIHALMNWSVPVFFMITGYCVLQKREVTYTYCFSHVLQYVCVLFTVGLAYGLMEEVFTSRTINFSIFMNSILRVVSGNLWDHMWFVYDIIGIYLVMPVIHLFMKQGNRDTWILTGLLFLFTIFIPTFEEMIPFGVSLPFGGYLFYVCLGGMIAKGKITPRLSYFIYFAGLLSAAWIIYGAGNFVFGYRHLAVCAMAASIFMMVCPIKIKSSKLISTIAQCTWGIYLIHPFYINIVVKVLNVNVLSSHAYVNLLALLGIIAVISFFTTYILRKIPIIRKLF